MARTKTLGVRFNDEIRIKLELEAQANGRSIASLIAFIVTQYFREKDLSKECKGAN